MIDSPAPLPAIRDLLASCAPLAMAPITATDLLRGLTNWAFLTVLVGCLASWTWLLRTLWRGGTLLPREPLVRRRRPPWGLGTILLSILAYALVSRSALEGYARATRGDRPEVRRVAAAGVEGARGDARPDAEAMPWGLSLTELMFVQGAINGALIVLLPGLARSTSGARLRDLGLSVRGWRRQAGVGIVAVLILMPVVYSVQAACVYYMDVRDLQSRKHPLEKMLRSEFSAGTAYLAFLTAVVLAPPFEELLFRGLLQSWLVKALDRLNSRIRASARAASGPAPGPPAASPPDPISASSMPDPDRVPEGVVPGWWEADDAEAMPRPLAKPAPIRGLGVDPIDAGERADEAFGEPDSKDGPGWSPAIGLGIVLTSMIFAALHAPQWPAPIPLFLLALGLGFVYQRTGSLLAPICMHAAFNGLSTLMLVGATLTGPAPERPGPRPVLDRVSPVEKGTPVDPGPRLAPGRDKT